MKRKYILFLIICLVTFTKLDVYACGEIKELRSSSGSVATVDESTFLITVPEDISAVTLYADTDYSWVSGYEPRMVPTEGVSELKIDGNTCGYGIYTYFVKFKKISNIIAENTPQPETGEQTAPTTTNNGQTTTNENDQTNTQGSGNLLLKSLTIKDSEIDFNPYTYEYTIEVGLDVVFLDIKAVPESEGVTTSISENAFSLKEGENIVAITLMDSNGNTSVYNITVNKVPPKSNNNYLESLTIEGYQLNFDPAKNIYDVQIGKDLSLNINLRTQDSKASYEIVGNSNLHTGSNITIKVTAEDGSVRDYVLQIERVFNIMDYWVYIVIVLLLILLGILLIISKKKKNKKNLGPQTIEAQPETAGVVQEATSQNVTSVEPQNNQENNMNAAQDVPVGTLKIIEPTDIETPVIEQPVAKEQPPTEVSPQIQPTPVNEEDNKTEIFEL